MNYAAVLKPKAPTTSAGTPRYMKEGWVNLKDYKPSKKETPQDDLDARLKHAGAVLRERWDRWNADHGIEYDYDRECSCSGGSSDDEDTEDDVENTGDDAENDYNDYQFIKKTTVVTH